MDKEEIKAKLDAYGIDYDGRSGEETLKALLDTHEVGLVNVFPEQDSPPDITVVPSVTPPVPEMKPMLAGGNYRVSLGVKYNDRTESHNYYHTLESIDFILNKIEEFKTEEGTPFTFVYRYERATKKMEGFMSEESLVDIVSCVKQGTL